MLILKTLCPDEICASVSVIDYERLWSAGYRALIFDIDNTLGSWGCHVLSDENILRLLESLERRGFRLGFLSNNRGRHREPLVAQLAPRALVWDAQKPRTHGYRTLLQRINSRPSEVVMIGDQLFTDIWGAKRAGLYAILVAPYYPQSDTFGARWRRPIERFILRHFCSTVRGD